MKACLVETAPLNNPEINIYLSNSWHMSTVLYTRKYIQSLRM